MKRIITNNSLKLIAVLMLLTLLIVSGCGGTSSTGSSGSTGASSSSDSSSNGGQDAGETKEWTIGWVNPTAQNPVHVNIQKALEIRARQLGGKVIALDSKLDVNKQISDVEQLIALNVDAIFILPLDAKAVIPALEKARDAGIYVIAVDFTVDEGMDQYPVPTQILQGRRGHAQDVAAYLNEQLPDGGKIAYIDIAFPVPTLKFLRDRFVEELKQYPQLELVEIVENPTDDAAGARPLVDQLLVKHKDLAAIVSYNDPGALGAYQAVTSAGVNKEDVLIVGCNAMPEAMEALADGKIDATFDLNPVKQGITAAELAYDVISGKVKVEDVPDTIVFKMPLYTRDNLDTVVSWADQLKELEGN